ncbi:hypothetical protein BH18ACT5_BH18ACT5_16390 [soil metagenome]
MKRGLWPVGVVGALIAAAYVSLVMSRAAWDPTVMLAEGVQAQPQLEYAEDMLGRKVAARPELGHDGRFFFILANDPFLLSPENHAVHLDLPTYRAQRILYPLLGGGFGLFGATATVWGLIAVNVLAAGFGSLAASAIGRMLGASRWLGLAFIINPGVIAELDIDGGGVVALALGLIGLYLLVRERQPWAVASLTSAVLARETMLLFVVGLVLWAWRTRKSFRPALLLIPAAAAIVWRLYSGNRLDSIEPDALQVEGLLRSFDLVPLRGALRGLDLWTGTEVLWTLCLVAILLLFVRRAWKSRAAVAWGTWPFAILSLFLSVVVWLEPYDIARAIAPIFVAYPLLLFAKGSSEASEVR